MVAENDKISTSKTHVVIIGIGSSGIAAAKTLSIKSDIEITILEARNCIGGRVNKVYMHKNLLDSTVAPKDEIIENVLSLENSKVLIGLGANWIHGLEKSGNPMFEIANQLQLSLQRTSSDDNPGDDVLLFDIAGEESHSVSTSSPYGIISPDDYSVALLRYEIIVDMVCKKEFLVDVIDATKYSLKEYFNIALKLSDEKFGRISDACYRCINWFLDRIAIDIGSSLEKTDISSYLEGESDGQYGEALVKGGYMQLLEHIMGELNTKVNLKFNHIAEKIEVESESNKVVVHCSNGEKVECNRVLLTVPVGVIKSNKIQFIPSIPRKIKELCSKVELGLMNTVWLWFPHIFWPEKYNFLGLAHSEEIKNIMFTTYLAPLVHDQYGQRQAILMCQVVGEFAKEIENMSDSTIAELATISLRKMFGASVVPSPVGCMHSSWHSDPFATGSYSFLPHEIDLTETNSSDISNTNEDVRTDCLSLDSFIYYAGEADSVCHRGTVHGAYQSGIKEAQNIYRSLLNN